MRIVVFFDLPVLTKSERRQATQFRNFLISDGFSMMQYSVYTRICNGMDSVETHIKRVTSQKPKAGSVRVLTVTEKQFESMKILIGDVNIMIGLNNYK